MIFIRFRLKLGRSLCFSVFVSVLFYRESHFFLAYFSAMIHEFAHGMAAYYRGIKPCGLSLGIFGIKLCLPQFNGLKDKLIVYSAGPISSLCVSLSFLLAEKIFDDIDPMGKLYQKYIHLSSAVKFCWFVCP